MHPKIIEVVFCGRFGGDNNRLLPDSFYHWIKGASNLSALLLEFKENDISYNQIDLVNEIVENQAKLSSFRLKISESATALHTQFFERLGKAVAQMKNLINLEFGIVKLEKIEKKILKFYENAQEVRTLKYLDLTLDGAGIDCISAVCGFIENQKELISLKMIYNETALYNSQSHWILTNYWTFIRDTLSKLHRLQKLELKFGRGKDFVESQINPFADILTLGQLKEVVLEFEGNYLEDSKIVGLINALKSAKNLHLFLLKTWLEKVSPKASLRLKEFFDRIPKDRGITFQAMKTYH